MVFEYSSGVREIADELLYANGSCRSRPRDSANGARRRKSRSLKTRLQQTGAPAAAGPQKQIPAFPLRSLLAARPAKREYWAAGISAALGPHHKINAAGG